MSRVMFKVAPGGSKSVDDINIWYTAKKATSEREAVLEFLEIINLKPEEGVMVLRQQYFVAKVVDWQENRACDLNPDVARHALRGLLKKHEGNEQMNEACEAFMKALSYL